jgi:hypothetical protein
MFNKTPVANRTPNVAAKRCNRYRPTDRMEDFIRVNVQLSQSDHRKRGLNTTAAVLKAVDAPLEYRCRNQGDSAHNPVSECYRDVTPVRKKSYKISASYSGSSL